MLDNDEKALFRQALEDIKREKLVSILAEE
jgi:hypothetical protein